MFERGKRDESGDGEGTAAAESSWRGGDATPARSGKTGGETAVIGRSIQINGDLRGNEDLRIEGDVAGTVELRNSHLTIGREGKVRADVYAKSITVDGTTEGDLYATERVRIHVNAQVRGNITSPKVAIEEGAKFKGSIEMDQAAVEQALGKSGARPAANAGERQNAKDKAPEAAARPAAKEAATNLKSPAG